jgi:hypothetical protein
MRQKHALSLPIFCLSLMSYSVSSELLSEPWVNTSDSYLRSCIDTLSQAGILNIPVNTYPLMWKSINAELVDAIDSGVDEAYQPALRCVKRALNYAKKDHFGFRISATNDNQQAHAFGEVFREELGGNFYKSFVGKNWAFKSSVHLRSNPDDAKDHHSKTYEGSYVAGIFGNWVASYDQVPQWWGPGKDSALALSNNAIAFPALRLTRHASEPFESPWLSWIGPWSFTTYLGEQEHSNEMSGINLWGMRINWRPLQSLEIGMTRTTQWGGEGRSENLRTFWNLIIGNDNHADAENPNAISIENEPGNQLAGLDFTYHLAPTTGIPATFYMEVIGEDEAGGLPSHTIHLLGANYFLQTEQASHQFYFETSDTMALCGYESNISNCAYQNHLYPEGYRRYGRSMGSTYDNDALTHVLGYQIQTQAWQGFAKLKFLDLNRDLQEGGNTVSPNGQSETVVQLGGRWPLLSGKLNAVATFKQIEMNNQSNENDALLSISWEVHY